MNEQRFVAADYKDDRVACWYLGYVQIHSASCFGTWWQQAHSVRVVTVVTCLEDYPRDMDDCWKKNEQSLQRQGMHFSKHACITSNAITAGHPQPYLQPLSSR